jgi:hypothetical protein
MGGVQAALGDAINVTRWTTRLEGRSRVLLHNAGAQIRQYLAEACKKARVKKSWVLN